VPNLVSVATSIAELACGEKLCTQSLTQSPKSLSHPAYLIHQEPKLLLWNILPISRGYVLIPVKKLAQFSMISAQWHIL